jgi:hypothetical protein
MNMQGQLTDAKAALKYMTGGKAYITLVNLSSGNRYTYRIELADKRNPSDLDRYFVAVLIGPDNWSNYKYMGMISKCSNGSLSFRRTQGSKIAEDAPSYIGFNFCFEQIKNNIIEGFEVWHEGKCGRCGRKLTVPESIASGFGPECITMLGASAIAASPVMASGSVAPTPNRNLNFDGSKRQPAVKASGAVAPQPQQAATPVQTPNVGNIDAEIRRRIDEYKADNPEAYYMDGELDEKQAFNVAFNKFRVQLQKEGR